MENEELASYFAAKNENEELKKKIAEMGSYRKEIHTKMIDLYAENRLLSVFLIKMDRCPFFWAKSYKKHIRVFLEGYNKRRGID